MPPQTTPGFDMNAFLQTMMQISQMQQQTRQQGRREESSGRHLGMGGMDINPQTGREPNNPFDSGFFRQSAADLPPGAIAESQGGTAMNQWAQPGHFGWSSPPTQSMAEGAVDASPPMFRVSPETLAFGGLSPRPYALGDERSPQYRQPQTQQAQPMGPAPTNYPQNKAPLGSPQRRPFSFGGGMGSRR